MYEVKFQREVDGFYIYVPTSLLKFAAETHEDYPMVVIDQDKFVDRVMFEIENNLGSEDSGMTGLTELLDKAMSTVAESGCNSVEFKED
jgi:uncharacterized protein YjbK